MPQRQLTGTRIRERRLRAGLRQAELAGRVGISSSYLNLIEHNKRRIGGKVLIAIAQELDVEPAQLTEGAEAALIATLREARATHTGAGAETEQAEELAGRFPGWAEVLARSHRRVATLERTVETLTDRLTHDPHLAAALHEVLSTVTSIRSTAAILADTREIEPEWRDRFQRNMNEDAARLADRVQALVTFLDREGESTEAAAPQEELDTWLADLGWHLPALEADTPEAADALREQADALSSAPARAQARAWLDRYADEAAQLPGGALQRWCADNAPDPGKVARAFGVSLPVAMRRLASLPADGPTGALGMVSCDASGTLTFRKPVDGFTVPRFGSACPLWPLFSALSQPMVPLRTVVEQPGRDTVRYLCYAVALPQGEVEFGVPPVLEAHMLIVPRPPGAERDGPARAVGASCRICPRTDCGARREPSILADGF
ncbi:short-chain fatty acyl-CoA regulator family protein [Lutimaribacter sp. EGI FJ00015]|uniref:Short-chain fatty acyl-CoA regulator family protein n=1 Tax=Lutimaribacter degradans TaxID=2945989 RepID=A0ACC5ZRF7_9RHOB|nr:helix-turn-helix transcriptional regulator [Lutimaribacter sp. EGI FJ00013]MCM2560902.1 short-chain fatty acyl-CoA regulator family protein [Lutimaribacter sp. EGI FJ00013]MCO0612153.1 short-chain fatty acyl-CoA regulator family protein [Lutimaribacter sp. EGI FJ00015]MCO0634727.1 short-chain fatty acyl-CoA regulator family protein [Lutimaribacter sp. EGI FJ00014]